MSSPVGTELSSGQDVPVLESNLKNNNVASINNDDRPKEMKLHCDEYTTLLKKYLEVVESELSRLKCQQSTKSCVTDGSCISRESKLSEKEMQAQEARIYRVPSWE